MYRKEIYLESRHISDTTACRWPALVWKPRCSLSALKMMHALRSASTIDLFLLGRQIASPVTPRLALMEDWDPKRSHRCQAERVENLSRSCTAIFFISITSSQKETAEIHVLSLLTNGHNHVFYFYSLHHLQPITVHCWTYPIAHHTTDRFYPLIFPEIKLLSLFFI